MLSPPRVGLCSTPCAAGGDRLWGSQSRPPCTVFRVTVPDAIHAFAAGFGISFGLIVAIGAQNAYVLRQGLRREHVAAVVTFCAVSDAALIVAGVGGMGAIITRFGWIAEIIRWAGAAFLATYGLLALRRALRPHHLSPTDGTGPSRRAALATIAALTWLNPHVYLDTLLLLGSVGATYERSRWIFALGAATASVTWFIALGYGAGRLSPLFSRPRAWKVLDLIIAAVMMTIAATLATGG